MHSEPIFAALHLPHLSDPRRCPAGGNSVGGVVL